MNNQRVLLAESGATKTEWRLLSPEGILTQIRTTGYNPNVMTEEAIRLDLAEARSGALAGVEVEKLVFYGAGIGGDSQESLMRRVLQGCWPQSELEVYHDLAASARSTPRSTGIACILGTGSNSCLYQDHDVKLRRGGHGYLFGDEGSGMDLGRHLIMGLLQKRFSDSVRNFVESQEGLSVYELKLAILKDPTPNVRMARLARHLDELVHLEEIQSMILNRFLAFLDATVCLYADFQAYPVDVMGSIGWYFQELFAEAARLRKLNMGTFVANPIDHLVQFHLRMLKG